MEKRRITLTTISADVDIQTDREGEANGAGTTANLLMKVLRSVDRNTTGPMSDEALSYASRLLAELTGEMKLLSLDKENAKTQRNLGKVREFATTKIMKLERRLRTKTQERKDSHPGEGRQQEPSIGDGSM